MTTAANRYQPDYAIHPGIILAERLEALDMSQAEAARRCGRSPKLISQIITGKAPIETTTALQFEKVLGLDASIWLGVESDYRLHLEREAEAQRARESIAWAKRFPIKELVKRGCISMSAANDNAVDALLSFFGVASIEAWQSKQGQARVAYRHSPSFKSDQFALATWLRLGELQAERTECADYRESAFKQALKNIRRLTATPSTGLLDEVQRLCLELGVVLALVKPLPRTALSGGAWWVSPRKAVIQLSSRHMRDDHLWFSLFHEAAHIVLHGKRKIFIHETTMYTTKDEAQANEWAADFLVPQLDWEQFTVAANFSRNHVLQFAVEQGIAPGIVVGRLQHEKLIRWNVLNDLRKPLKWNEYAHRNNLT